LVSGSLRAGSTNTAVLETARMLAPERVNAVLYRGMGGLPHFNPDDDREGETVHGAVTELREQVRSADALLICTPDTRERYPGR
jgi:NAD(P)H-dependent FMN reductase